MSLLNFQQDRVTLQQQADVQDSSAGITRWGSPVTLATMIPASIQPASASRRILFAQANMFITHSIYLSADYGIKLNNRLIITDGNGNTQYFLVRGYYPLGGKKFGAGVTWNVDAEEQPQ